MKTPILESVTLHITPLSPVHVGTGEDYEPTNYVMDKGVLFAFDSDIASEVLTPSQREELLKMVSRPARQAEDLIMQVQSFIYNNREAFAAASTHCLPVSAGVFDLYQKRVGQTANREAGGGGVINKLAIERTFFNPYNQQPVIPGSSIKGAIRTALLDDVNDGNELTRKEREFLEDKRQSTKAKANEALQERLFAYRRDVDGKSKKLLQCDPMRLVHVVDASYQTPGLYGSEVRFAVNRKKREVLKGGKVVQSQAEAKNLYQLLECLPPRYRSFQSSLTIQDLQDIDHIGKTPAKSLRWKVKDVAAACNRFYRERLAVELKVLQERRYLDPNWERLADEVLNGTIARRLDQGSAFLLRIGRHSGAESVTLNGVRSIKILEGKGADGKQTSSYQLEAKTIWLAAPTSQARSGMLPFGWALIEIQADRKPLEDWLELRERLAPFQKDAEAWQTKQKARAVEFARVREELLRRKREAEEKARLEAEAEAKAAREETERLARLSAMSPEEQALEEFRAYYQRQKAKGRYQPGGEFDQRRLEFFRKVLAWEDRALRRQAADLIFQTIKEWTDWPNKKERKQQFRQWLEELERK